MFIGLAECLMDPVNSCGTRKLARTPRVINNNNKNKNKNKNPSFTFLPLQIVLFSIFQIALVGRCLASYK